MKTRFKFLRTGKKHHSWKGGRNMTSNGYISKYIGKGKYQLEHRLIIEQLLKRKLETWEQVHHINGDKTDNRIENLKLMSISEHAKFEKMNGNVNRWSRDWDCCRECKNTDKPNNGNGYCRNCSMRNRYQNTGSKKKWRWTIYA